MSVTPAFMNNNGGQNNPSTEDWTRWKSTIINLYQQNTLHQVMRIMRDNYNFRATERQYTRHLKEWNVFKTTNSETRRTIRADAVRAYLNDEEQVHSLEELKKARGQLRKEMNHEAQPEKDDEFDLQVLDHLIAQLSAQNKRRVQQSPQETTRTPENTVARHQGFHGNARSTTLPVSMETPFMTASYGEAQSYHRHQPHTTLPRLSPNIAGIQDAKSKASTDAPSLFEQCLQWTRAIYTSILEQYIRVYDAQAQKSNETMTTSETFDTSNNTFWHDFESALYLLKMNNDELAKPFMYRVREAVGMICVTQCFTLLRNIFSSLAPMNTSMKPGLQQAFLKEFIKATETSGITGRNPLYELFERLCRLPDPSNKLYQELLEVLIQCAWPYLLNKNMAELFELRWTLVRFKRRAKSYAGARADGENLIRDAQEQFGRTNTLTRKAMSELAYVHNDQGKRNVRDGKTDARFREALAITEEVVARGKDDLGPRYPDSQCVYAMEDVAEVIQNLGGRNCMHNSAGWLRRAYCHAQKLWGVSAENTQYIESKLKETEELIEE